MDLLSIFLGRLGTGLAGFLFLLFDCLELLILGKVGGVVSGPEGSFFLLLNHEDLALIFLLN